MNRILTADVILTLTREQAARLLSILEGADGVLVWMDLPISKEVRGAVVAQCAKQGVQL